MPKIVYEPCTLRAQSLAIAEQAASIAEEYNRAGFDVTLRQLYYQFVGRGLTAQWKSGHNTEQSYKRLGRIVDQARMSGIIDWNHVVDRTRGPAGPAHWTDPGDVINSAAYGYGIDKWTDQSRRVELWVEKEALSGVVDRVARARDCNYMACRGYMSASAMWRAAQRIGRIVRGGQDVVILHLGDHDPSGIDMTRDNMDRLGLMLDRDLVAYGGADRMEFRRIALSMDQIEQYNPPPNPAKLTDSRSPGYVEAHGDSSWELDALPPDVLVALMNEHIDREIDQDSYDARHDQQERERDLLMTVSRNWSEVQQFAEDQLD